MVTDLQVYLFMNIVLLITSTYWEYVLLASKRSHSFNLCLLYPEIASITLVFNNVAENRMRSSDKRKKPYRTTFQFCSHHSRRSSHLENLILSMTVSLQRRTSEAFTSLPVFAYKCKFVFYSEYEGISGVMPGLHVLCYTHFLSLWLI